MLPHVFDLFTQADRSLDRSQGGLGIGLTLVKTLVEIARRNRSRPAATGRGRAASSSVRLPLARPECRVAGVVTPEPASQRPATANPHPSRRVLVVDDNADAAETLAVLLRASGHSRADRPRRPDGTGGGRTVPAEMPFSWTSACRGWTVMRSPVGCVRFSAIGWCWWPMTGYGGDDVKPPCG